MLRLQDEKPEICLFFLCKMTVKPCLGNILHVEKYKEIPYNKVTKPHETEHCLVNARLCREVKMAKEIIDAVKQAEIESQKLIDKAKTDADSLLKEAKQNAKETSKKKIDEASALAKAKAAEASEKAEQTIGQAVKAAEAEVGALRASVASKTEGAVKSVLQSLLD